MTLANKITIARIAAIPAFVMLAIYYGESVQEGTRQPWLRYAAMAVFLLAAVTDALDGFVARRFNQHTKLGRVLDPIADKGLLLSALLVLTFGHWEVKFPLWFLILVIARDIAIVLGCLLLQFLNGDVTVRPSWMGKVATFMQMAAIAWVMLQLHTPPPIYIICLAGVFTLASWIGYGIEGVRQVKSAEKG